MLLSSIPVKFTVPWANSAGGSYINTISLTSLIGITNGRASLVDGFVPLNFTDVSAGGVPPFGTDHNGILNWITQWSRWHEAGGPVRYDSAFSTAIGGYPQGAILSGTTLGRLWINLVDNNTTNPDTGGANWTAFEGFARTWSALNTFSAGGYFTGYDSGGADIRLNGGGSASAMLRTDSASLYILLSTTPTGSFTGNRPFQINLSTGDTLLGGAGEAVRLGSGAYGTGDTQRAVRYGDFVKSLSGSTWYTVTPDGMIDQYFLATALWSGGGLFTTGIALPVAYPTSPGDAMVCWWGPSPPPGMGLAINTVGTTTVNVTINATSFGGSGSLGVAIRSRGY
jgi:hypothetical protein